MTNDLPVAIIGTEGIEPALVRIVVIDAVATRNRPSAIGYAMFDFMRECLRQYKQYPKIVVQFGVMSPHAILRRKNAGTPIFAPRLQDGEYGEVYELIAAVENGNPGIIGS